MIHKYETNVPGSIYIVYYLTQQQLSMHNIYLFTVIDLKMWYNYIE